MNKKDYAFQMPISIISMIDPFPIIDLPASIELTVLVVRRLLRFEHLRHVYLYIFSDE